MWKMGANCTTATQRMEDINKRRNKAATKTEAIKYPCVCVCVCLIYIVVGVFQLRSKSQLGKMENWEMDTRTLQVGGVGA